jgi:hypothetical protein
MDYDVHIGQGATILEAPKDFTDTPLDAMTHDGLTHLAAGRDTETSVV